MKVFKSEKAKRRILAEYDRLLDMWDTDYAQVDVETTFGTTHCIVTGDKENPPLFLFHGVGDNSAVMWMLNIRELSRHFYCIAVDTLGGPGKSVPNERFTKKNFTLRAWINEIARYFRLECFNIAGVSNGAVMAYHYATIEGAKVSKVVCMEGGMIISPMKSMVQTIGRLFPYILFPTKHNMTKALKKLCAPNSELFDKHPEIIDHIVSLMLSHNQGAMFVHTIESYTKLNHEGLGDRLYFLLGEYNLGQSGEFIEILNTLRFKYQIVKDAGHAMNHEQAQVVNREIIGFLSGNQAANHHQAIGGSAI